MTRWIGALFALGSLCFVIAPLPGFLQLVGAEADGIVFFVGSLFFTSAAALQLISSRFRSLDWWASLVQFAGTIFFNVSTYDALDTALSVDATDRVVWAPDALGSICFLVASVVAWAAARGADARDRRIAALNLVGSGLFGIAAVASYIVPSTGDVVALAAANVTTSAGALCFLAGALLLLPARADEAEVFAKS